MEWLPRSGLVLLSIIIKIHNFQKHLVVGDCNNQYDSDFP
jgi:hypothetical protein